MLGCYMTNCIDSPQDVLMCFWVLKLLRGSRVSRRLLYLYMWQPTQLLTVSDLSLHYLGWTIFQKSSHCSVGW